ncbi:MAG: glycerophosphodiester phosphodiesterase [Clostridia bacterium]|nr:glycerophosphodiester phosphodiesterase [Clostridia bacterium]
MNIFDSWLVQQPIAHRGLHDKTTPENSLAAYEKAINAGYAIEIDVRIIADGTVVVFHDEALSRLTDNDGYIKFLNKADLDLLKLKGSEEHIPTFEEVLKFVDGRVPLLIEIKNNDKVGALEKAVIELLKDYHGEYAVQSFNPYVLEYFYKHAPNILRGQLAGYFKGEKLSFFKKYALKRMLLNNKVSHPDFISYEARKLPNMHVRKYKQLPLIAWTVKSQSEYVKVVKHCDNIIFENFEPTI